MCGLSGYLSRKQSKSFPKELLDSLENQSYRGPDDSGSWTDEYAGLAHSRLAIIDLASSGHQPMTSGKGNLQIVFNGEIFNYKELKEELIAEGLIFHSNSDTEVILHGFSFWGTAVFEKLNGMFAIAIYDPILKELVLARDRFGIKPLYYYIDDDYCFFASELGALLSFPISRKLNHNALYDYFQFSYIPGNESMIEGVQQLEQGNWMKISRTKVEKKTYYTIPLDQSDIGYSEALNEIRRLLKESVHSRLISDVPVASFLSSGIDSSIITMIASKMDTGIHAYSASFSEYPYFNESIMAREWARNLAIDHSTINLREADLIEAVEEMLNAFSEPFADSSAIAYYSLSKKTSKEVKVVLSGDGADELFGGYRKHKAEYLLREKPLLRKFASSFSFLLNEKGGSRNSNLGNYKRQFAKFAEAANMSENERYLFWASFQTSNEVNDLLNVKKRDHHRAEMNIHSMNDFLREDMRYVLPGDMLYKADRSSMHHGLEVRLPFLDHHLVDFVFSLPSEWKLKNGERKSLLKESYKNQLPNELLHRKKRGFEVPLYHWLKGPLKEKVDRELNEEIIREQGILNYSAVNKIILRSRSHEPGDSPALVWAILVFQSWLKKYNPVI
jgi:asparagine synthase (glutamine-hydrolysing)